MTAPKSESRLKELEEENELLLLQLHQVQEELERYFQQCQVLEKGQGGTVTSALANPGWVDDQVPETLAEVARLKTLVETQARLHHVEAANALNARLGDILIQSVSSTGKLVGLPARLLKIWRESQAREIPAALGGKNCDKVIEAHKEGGFEAVAKLLSPIAAPTIKANAYTVLARHLRHGQPAQAAEAARLAYEEDPHPYRLKWLAFRLHEAGNVLEADAMLDVLPIDTQFSDTEAQKVDQVRHEARRTRLREAKQRTAFAEKRAEVERQLKTLSR
jgi:hypothetical protein